MQMISKKNEVLTNAVVQKLMSYIKHLKNEIRLLNLDREAVNNVAELNFGLA